MGAGLAAPFRPALAAVELAHQQQPAAGGGVDVRGELGDLALELSSGIPSTASMATSRPDERVFAPGYD
jgi:hypothetical protein